jgi:hypothetical protein
MKKETLAEFLARGGKITIIPPMQSTAKSESVKITSKTNTINGDHTPIISTDDADLFYGEFKPRKAKKSTTSVDLSAHLPEALRKKYVDSIVNPNEDDE